MDCTEVTWKEERSRVPWEMDLGNEKKPVEFATFFEEKKRKTPSAQHVDAS